MAGMLEYKCPCCDGAIQFDSATQKMKCPYCDTEFDVDTLKGYDEELKDEKPSEKMCIRDRYIDVCIGELGASFHPVVYLLTKDGVVEYVDVLHCLMFRCV